MALPERPAPPKSELASILRVQRAKLDVTQTKIARRMGATQSQVAKWESRSIPGAQWIPDMSSAYELPPEVLLDAIKRAKRADSLDTPSPGDDKDDPPPSKHVVGQKKGQGKTERSTPPDHGTVRPKEFEQPAMLQGGVYDGQDSTRLLRAAAEKEARSLETQADFFEDLAERFRDFARDIRVAKRKPRVPPRRRRSRRKASR